jgi:ribonuclease T2
MTRLAQVLTLVLAALAGAAAAEGERAGAFDYYVLSLSWTPTWCALEGDARGAAQCDAGRGHGFTLHGLWPQYDSGWPSYCPTSARAPSRAETGAMADIMGSGGLAWHQWRKHGTCSGLSAEDYFRLSRLAYDAVTRPNLLRRLDAPVRLPAEVIEDAFLEANPGLADDMMTVTCRDGHVQEVRICLTRDLAPRRCGADVVRDCTLGDALFPPMR